MNKSIDPKENLKNAMPIYTWEALRKAPEDYQRIFKRNEKAIEAWLAPAREIFERVKAEGRG